MTLESAIRPQKAELNLLFGAITSCVLASLFTQGAAINFFLICLFRYCRYEKMRQEALVADRRYALTDVLFETNIHRELTHPLFRAPTRVIDDTATTLQKIVCQKT